VFGRALKRAIARVYSDARVAEDVYDISPRHLRDVFIIETYRRQHAPTEVRFQGDTTQFANEVLTLIRRRTRVPKKLHAAISAD
jgi:hypothetical protein